MTKGTTLTLQGEQAETYVRSRRSVGVGTNEARMARQEAYIKQLSVQLDEKLQKDQNFAVDAYDALQPYLTTSMAKGQLVNEPGRQRTTPGWTPSNRMAPIRSGRMALWSFIRMPMRCSRRCCNCFTKKLNKRAQDTFMIKTLSKPRELV